MRFPAVSLEPLLLCRRRIHCNTIHFQKVLNTSATICQLFAHARLPQHSIKRGLDWVHGTKWQSDCCSYHALSWKVDLDIAGVDNSLLMQEVATREIFHPYLETTMNQVLTRVYSSYLPSGPGSELMHWHWPFPTDLFSARIV